MVILCHPGLAYSFNFRHSGTLALSPEHKNRVAEVDVLYDK